MHDDFFQLHLCNYLEKVFVVKLSFGFGDVTLPLKKPELFFIFPFLGFFFTLSTVAIYRCQTSWILVNIKKTVLIVASKCIIQLSLHQHYIF